MADVPLEISFEESDDGFILRNKSADGTVVEIKIPPEQLHRLKAAIDLWTDRKILAVQLANGTVQQAITHQVAEVKLWTDLVQENVLLFVKVPSGGTMTLAVPLSVADDLAQSLPHLLATIRAEKPIKQ